MFCQNYNLACHWRLFLLFMFFPLLFTTHFSFAPSLPPPTTHRLHFLALLLYLSFITAISLYFWMFWPFGPLSFQKPSNCFASNVLQCSNFDHTISSLCRPLFYSCHCFSLFVTLSVLAFITSIYHQIALLLLFYVLISITSSLLFPDLSCTPVTAILYSYHSIPVFGLITASHHQIAVLIMFFWVHLSITPSIVLRGRSFAPVSALLYSYYFLSFVFK